jgi:PAS domain S-box-containing protein
MPISGPTDSRPPRPRGYIAPRLRGSAWTPLLDLPLPISVYRVDGTLLLINSAMLELFGYPLAQLLEKGWVAVTQPNPDARERTYALNAQRLAATGTTRFVRWARFADGRDHRVETTSTRVRLPDGEPAVMSTVSEVTAEPRLAGDGLRGHRELVEEGPEVWLRIDVASERLVLVSAGVTRATGRAPEELVGELERFTRCVALEARAAWEQSLAMVRQGDACIFDLVLCDPAGRRTILVQSLYPVRDTDGRVRYIEGAGRDETAVRQIEELRAQNQQRIVLDQLKSELLANVSHELRTPLVSIKGYNELLQRGALGPLTPRQARALEIAGANSERLIELIETLLDFARREEGRLQLHTARVDLRQVAADAMAQLRERIASRNLALRVDLGERPLEVVGDRARLTQVFRALIANAEKFSESPGGQIQVTAATDGASAVVAVADHGIGIPREAYAKIFDRFYQVDASPTRRFGGAGLGLALAKEIVTLHDGEITVDSVVGGGSTFTVRLPLAEALDRPLAVPSSPGRPVVLVGADDATFARLAPLLADEAAVGPLDLMRGESEADVVRRARRHRPDLVVLAFPGADGTVDVIKSDAETSHLPVVVISDERRPIGRSDLTASIDDPDRLLAGLARLVGHERVRPGRRPRVVVVEDEIEILDFCRFVLEREGFEVLTLEGDDEDLSRLVRDSQLLIMDIALEDADGLDVCRRLKADPATRGVPILIMTAMSGERVRQGSLGAGADGYLLKPFGVDEFVRQVRLHAKEAPARFDEHPGGKTA